jgi:hypothetical protein
MLQTVGDLLRRQVAHLESASLGILVRHLRVPAIADIGAYVVSPRR